MLTSLVFDAPIWFPDHLTVSDPISNLDKKHDAFKDATSTYVCVGIQNLHSGLASGIEPDQRLRLLQGVLPLLGLLDLHSKPWSSRALC